jgi:hypothetical protein
MVEDTGSVEIKKIGIVGGTGKEGKGLAYRWAKAGYEVSIGSRQIEKAQAAADEVNDLLKSEICVDGLTNLDVARQADLVVMTVPFSVHKEMLETIRPVVQGKIVIDVTVPLVPPKVTKVQMPPAGSAAQEAQSILGESVQVCSAFQNISYEHLLHDEKVACDVLVCGSSKAAIVEGMTSILIGINKQYGVQSAGIRITGVTR